MSNAVLYLTKYHFNKTKHTFANYIIYTQMCFILNISKKTSPQASYKVIIVLLFLSKYPLL